MLPCRLRRLVPLLAIACAQAFAAPAHAQQATPEHPVPVLATDGLGKGTIPLDGPWQFHLGDDTAWANPAFDDSQWEQLTADKPWGAQGHKGYTGIAWYRRHVSLTLAPGASPDVALYLPVVSDAYEVYWNGGLVGHFGKLPPHPVWYYLPPPQTMGLGHARFGVLAVRIWKAPLTSNDSVIKGGYSAAPSLGSPAAIGALKAVNGLRWTTANGSLFALDALYFLVGLIALFAWLRDRRQMLLFWAAASYIPVVTIQLLELYRFPIPYLVSVDMAQPLFGVAAVGTWYLLALLLRLEESRIIMRILRVLAIVALVDCMLDGLATYAIGVGSGKSIAWAQGADWVLSLIFNVVQLLPTPLIICAVFRRKHLSAERWVVAFFALLANLVPVFQGIFLQGSRFAPVQWLADLILQPLFTINGAVVDAQAFTATLLLFAIVFAVYRYSQEDRRHQIAVEQEFKSARELQRVLIPEQLPATPGYALTSSYKPASEVGGDFFQVIAIEDEATLIVLGDVSGKGLKAAMAVSLIVGMVRALAHVFADPGKLLAEINERLVGRLQGGFATAVALRLTAHGNCTLACAGHLPPFLNGHELNLPGAFPLGIVGGVDYQAIHFELRASDRLVLFTDGLLEARNLSGELYGFARLHDLFSARPTAAQATEAAVAFGQDDDITVLTLTRLAAGDETISLHAAPALA